MLDPALFERRLREFDPLEEIYLSGGEPFEHISLDRIIRSARAAARSVVIYSSGVRIGVEGNEPLPSEALRAASRLGVSRIDVSLYAARAEEHDAVTLTPGSFERTLETLQRLRAEGIPFGVHHVPLGSSSHVSSVANLASRLGAVRLHVLSLAPQGRARSLGALAIPAEVLEDVRRLQRESWPFEVIVSSALRRALGITEPTPRDALRSTMLDVRGFLYPSEGRRLPTLRSRSSFGERPIRELLDELRPS
jgi:MoaA/NifB/PqqE/SkfB family radical SAM enzyme